MWNMSMSHQIFYLFHVCKDYKSLLHKVTSQKQLFFYSQQVMHLITPDRNKRPLWKSLLGRKATREKGPVIEFELGTHNLSRSFSHELSVPAANPSSPIALCNSCRCATIQQPLKTYTSRMVLCHVMVVGSPGS